MANFDGIKCEIEIYLEIDPETNTKSWAGKAIFTPKKFPKKLEISNKKFRVVIDNGSFGEAYITSINPKFNKITFTGTGPLQNSNGEEIQFELPENIRQNIIDKIENNFNTLEILIKYLPDNIPLGDMKEIVNKIDQQIDEYLQQREQGC